MGVCRSRCFAETWFTNLGLLVYDLLSNLKNVTRYKITLQYLFRGKLHVLLPTYDAS